MSASIGLHSIFIDQLYYGGESQLYSHAQLQAGSRRFRDSAGRGFSGLQPRLRLQVWNSLIYKIAAGEISFEEYKKYLNVNPQSEHSVMKFQELIQAFNIEKLELNKILLEKKGNEFQVVDGVHRLALYFLKSGKFSIPRAYIQFSENPTQRGKATNLKRYEKKILRGLRKTKGGRFSNGWSVTRDSKSGYHGYKIFGLDLIGQRDPQMRLEIIERQYALDGKNVLDLGCNTGGMLFHIADPGQCVGIDFDSRCISAANLIKRLIGKFDPEFSNRFHFQFGDLNSDFEKLSKMISEYKITTCFVLSIGSWVSNWHGLYTFLTNAKIDIVLETNNDSEGLPQLELIRSQQYIVNEISNQSMDDSTGNYGRRTYLCIPDKDLCQKKR
jgi:hypothetical protein